MPNTPKRPLGSGTVARQLGRVARHPRLVLAAALIIAVGAGALAARLRLRASIAELLPTSDPAVIALERTQARAGDLHLLLVGVRSPDRAANLRYAAALTRHLQALPPSVCQIAAYHLRDLRDFFQRNRWLYASEADLEDARDRLRGELVRHKNPLAIDLSDDGDASDTDVAAKLSASGTRLKSLEDRFPEGDFVRGDFAWVAALPPGGVLGEDAGAPLLAAVRAFVAANPPAAYHPAMQVLPGGPIVTTIRQREAVEHDVISVTVICLLIISLSIGLYFRSLRALPMVVAPAMLGTLVAFGAADLTFGFLNSSTAFLGSIILGNGINYAIVLLAQMRERRRVPGTSAAQALVEAIDGVWRSTLAAALAAAVAYASLMLTGFRGFSQFGFMAAIGSLGCWAATFLVLPALLLRFGHDDRRAAVAPAPLRFDGLGRLVRRHHGALLWGSLALTVAAGLGLGHFAEAPFEYDFRKLATEPEQDQTHQQFTENMNAVFGRWHSPTVVLGDSLAEVEPLRRAIRAKDDPHHPVIGQVMTIGDLLPGPADAQERKLGLLREIRKLGTDPAIELLDGARRRQITDNLPPADLRAVSSADLPALVRRPFTEVDGTVGRPLLVYPAEHVSMWDGRDLLGMAGVLQTLKLDDGAVIQSSGSPMVFGAMLRAILHDGPRATLLALFAVLVVVTLVVRPFGTALLAVGTMLIGATWMLGTAGLGGVRITFLNFIALPITFGIGIEYAVNVVARMRREAEPAAAVASTGSAVALCSWTTIVGYGSLLAARSHALRGFGAMAILGELSCLLAAVLALPALMTVLARRRRAAPSPLAIGQH